MSERTIIDLEAIAHLADVPEPCPYLENKVATLRFVNGLVAGGAYRQMLDEGYRRCGPYMYRPVCRGCDACKILRVPVEGFATNKEQRRVWRRGVERFEGYVVPPTYTEEKARIYERYLREQHGDADARVTEERYTDFLVASCLGARTIELQLRDGERLVGVGILDRLDDALSTVYFYYDPDYAKFGLGTFSALYEIKLARRWGLRYYYLGYYIRDCGSMSYKARFKPCELRNVGAREWERVWSSDQRVE